MIVKLHEKYVPFVFQQSRISCCLVSSFISLNEYLYQKNGGVPTKFSVHYSYNNSKIKEFETYPKDQIDIERGLHVSSLINSIIECGIAQQKVCPSNVEQLNNDFIPTPEIIEMALNHKHDFKIRYISKSLKEIKKYLDEDYPVVALVMFDEQIYTVENSKQVLNPLGRNCNIGHSILITGYTDSYFIFQNSFGEEWGYNGFGHLSFQFLRVTYSLYTIDNCVF